MPEETRSKVVTLDVTGLPAETAIRDWTTNNLLPAADTEFGTSDMALSHLPSGQVTIHFGKDSEGGDTTQVRGHFERVGNWTAS